MGIIFLLLLLIVSLTSASPLRQGQRNGMDSDVSGGADQPQRSEVKERRYAIKPKIIPQSKVNKVKLSNLKDSGKVKIKLRRSPYKPSCQLGTCVIHNLAHNLHQLSKMEGKEKSKNANNPYGYGR